MPGRGCDPYGPATGRRVAGRRVPCAVVHRSLGKKKFELKSDEDKVIELLREVGGQLYQSMVTKRLGFSKAKTSILLKAMEEKGLVKRKKMGREIVVTLR